MRVLLDEMYPSAIADQLRARGIDAASVHEGPLRALEQTADVDVLAAAGTAGGVLVTENVRDFGRIERELLGAGGAHGGLVFTTNRQFPRAGGDAVGRLVEALTALARSDSDLRNRSVFLRPAD